ncbi:hypothetical protein F2P56_036760 [Juglans regia]|uniref:Uncharacterized protein n=1 Tax=Juglans regia TaxID=51240 RepID=A0A833TWN0_JUGRE|nr:hypothetical protein F2P56_036760 [Juglans regia]
MGASRGVLLMWDKRVVELVEDCIEIYSVAGSFKNIKDGWMWVLAGVYGPNVDRDRSFLWEELADLYYLWDLPWCLFGDFNIVRFPGERAGATTSTRAMEDFLELIFDLNLVDLPLVGGVSLGLTVEGGQGWINFYAAVSCRANGNVHWNMIFSRNAQDWEIDEIAGFFSFLYSMKIGGNGRENVVETYGEQQVFF